MSQFLRDFLPFLLYNLTGRRCCSAVSRETSCKCFTTSEPDFYGDLVYKFRKIIGKNNFPYHYKKIIVRDKKIGFNVDVMQQTACLVVNPIKVNSFAYLFNCTTVGRASD